MFCCRNVLFLIMFWLWGATPNLVSRGIYVICGISFEKFKNYKFPNTFGLLVSQKGLWTCSWGHLNSHDSSEANISRNNLSTINYINLKCTVWLRNVYNFEPWPQSYKEHLHHFKKSTEKRVINSKEENVVRENGTHSSTSSFNWSSIQWTQC